MGIFDFIKRNQKIVVAALLVLAVPSYFIYDYTQNNPKFCTSCHLMNDAYETWDASAMHDLNCHNCHETNMIESLDHVREVIFEKPDEVTKPTVIENELCEKCHASNDPKWIQVSNTAGHKVHIFTQDEEPECIGCHGLQLHVFEPPEEACYKCHDEDYEGASEEMGAHCTVCHEFTVTDHELIPQREDCVDCHDSQQTMGVSFPEAAHNDTACIDCHNPHIEEQHIECSECHEVGLGGGLHAVVAHYECSSCHVPHSSDPMRGECLSCHVDMSNHGGSVECSLCHRFED